MWSGQPPDDTWYDHYRRWRWALLAPLTLVAGVYVLVSGEGRVPFTRSVVHGWQSTALGLALVVLGSVWCVAKIVASKRARS